MPVHRFFDGFAKQAVGWLTVLIGMLSVGCAAVDGPQVLNVQPGQYDAAFDAALDVAEHAGFSPRLRDRRSGVIGTAPGISPSVAEPWRYDAYSPGQLVENTIAMQRRVVRFEFTPSMFAPEPMTDGPWLTGPAVVPRVAPPEGSQTKPEPEQEPDPREPTDLTRSDAPLELRVWAYIERSQTIGRRRSTWTRLKTTQANIPDTEQNFWVPVARDHDLERRLLAAVEDAITDPPTSPDDAQDQQNSENQ